MNLWLIQDRLTVLWHHGGVVEFGTLVVLGLLAVSVGLWTKAEWRGVFGGGK